MVWYFKPEPVIFLCANFAPLLVHLTCFYPGLGIVPVGLVADGEHQMLRSLSVTKPTGALPKHASIKSPIEIPTVTPYYQTDSGGVDRVESIKAEGAESPVSQR